MPGESLPVVDPLDPTAYKPGAKLGSPGEDESAELTMHVALTPELEQKVLYCGLEVEVLEPASLRERIAETPGVLWAGRDADRILPVL